MVKHALLIATLALTACAGPRLETSGGPSEKSVTLTDARIQLTILPNAWTGYPSDLDHYYTPVELTEKDVRVFGGSENPRRDIRNPPCLPPVCVHRTGRRFAWRRQALPLFGKIPPPPPFGKGGDGGISPA